MSERFWQWQIQNGDPVVAGKMTVTPQTQVLSLRLPFGGFVWNRPAAVLVEENGRYQRLPIPDMTRMIVLAAVVVSTAVTMLAWWKKQQVGKCGFVLSRKRSKS